MKFEKLENIAEIIAGQSPPSETYNKDSDGIPFFQGKADFGKMYPTVRYWCKKPTKIANPNDILMSVRAPVGPVNICNTKSCIGRGLSAIRVKKNFSFEYVYYYLKVNEKLISRLGVGSTFSAINQKDIKEIKIPIPEKLEDQIRIATILSKAEELIAQRKQSISLLDEYLKSLFLEMFGDPVKNEKGLKKIRLEKLGKWKSGGTPSRKIENYFNGYIPWIISGELNQMYISESKEKISDEAVKNSNASFIEIGSLLLGMYDTAALKSSINTKKVTCNQAIAFAKLDDKICNTIFVYFNIQIGRDFYKSQQRGVRQKNMNLSMIKGLEILFPPLSLQTQFAEIVDKVEKLKVQYQNSLHELQNLYGSLSQKAFKGELSLNKETEI